MHKNIVLKIQGGIGNQLFQIIYAKSLANEYGINKIYYTDYYFWKIFYPYKIHKFYPLMIDKLGVNFVKLNPILSFFLGIINRKSLRNFLNIFDKIIFFSDDNECDNYKESFITVLDGFWQESSLIWKYRSVIRKWIFSSDKFRFLFSEKNKNYCVMHFRKGDYINNPHFKGLYYDLPISYYEKALKMFNLHSNIIIVTDNEDWVNQNEFEFNFKINQGGMISDLNKIINSDYKIIANSSFSLLGAYLGKSDNVAIPSKWWGNKRKNRKYNTNKFPSDWSLICCE